MLDVAVYYLFNILLLIALCLHILGMYCIFRQHSHLHKQSVLLLNLSVTEILNIVFVLVHLTLYQRQLIPEEEVGKCHQLRLGVQILQT